MASVLPPLENVAADIADGQMGRRTATVDTFAARAYAAATNDLNAAYLEGRYAPPVFGVVPSWGVLLDVLGQVIPPELQPMLLHTEHDMYFHRALVPGMALSTVGETYTVRTVRSGTHVTVRLVSEDDRGEPVLEQFGTMFVRGMTGQDMGSERPDHAFPDAARQLPVAVATRHVDTDQTYRYRDASGDTNPIHVDDEFAKGVKLPGIILHGLCTMAMCGSVVVDEAAGGDPGRLARLAVRFAKPVFPDSDLTVSLYDASSAEGWQAYAFEASSGGKRVVRDGRAEVRD